MQRRDLLEFLITFPNKMENLLYLVSKLCIIFATFFWICFIIELFPVTWLRLRMNQKQFSNLTVLNIHKERTDRLSTTDMANEFTDHYANRKWGKQWQICLNKKKQSVILALSKYMTYSNFNIIPLIIFSYRLFKFQSRGNILNK